MPERPLLPDETARAVDEQQFDCLVSSPSVDPNVQPPSFRQPIQASPKHCLVGTWTLSVLYVFAGKVRKADIREHLELMQHEFKFSLKMTELDTIRDKSHDVTSESLMETLLLDVKNGEYDVVIVTPPCNTFSRSRSNWRDCCLPLGIPMAHWQTPAGL